MTAIVTQTLDCTYYNAGNTYYRNNDDGTVSRMAYDGSGSNSMDSLSAEQLQAIGLTRRERGAFHWDAMDPAKFEDPQDADC